MAMDSSNNFGTYDSKYQGKEFKENPAKMAMTMAVVAATTPRSPLSFMKFAVLLVLTMVLLLSISVQHFKLTEDKLGLDPDDLIRSLDFMPPKRVYVNNGYLMASCNGGLNQMRTAIADMVVIATYMNVTLIVPDLDKEGYWQDHSAFQDIFNVDHFITSVRDKVRILKQLPADLKKQVGTSESVYSMYPISFASMRYYYEKVLPRIKTHRVLRFTLTDARLANNGLSEEIQKLRCRVYYDSIRFTQQIEETGQKIVGILKERGPYLALHLRYEKDMIAFSGCTEGFSKEESKELTNMRYSYQGWKHFPIDAKRRRQFGSCPLTPEETGLALQALGIDSNMTIYIAAGHIHASAERMQVLKKAYPNMVRKEAILEASDLTPFKNHSNHMAALDYIVSLESDIFVPTFNGNMAMTVEGHRRYLGFRKTILLDRMSVVKLIDMYRNKRVSWEDFSEKMKAAHANRMGQPTMRKEKPSEPRYEDYFYSNPQECLHQSK